MNIAYFVKMRALTLFCIYSAYFDYVMISTQSQQSTAPCSHSAHLFARSTMTLLDYCLFIRSRPLCPDDPQRAYYSHTCTDHMRRRIMLAVSQFDHNDTIQNAVHQVAKSNLTVLFPYLVPLLDILNTTTRNETQEYFPGTLDIYSHTVKKRTAFTPANGKFWAKIAKLEHFVRVELEAPPPVDEYRSIYAIANYSYTSYMNDRCQVEGAYRNCSYPRTRQHSGFRMMRTMSWSSFTGLSRAAAHRLFQVAGQPYGILIGGRHLSMDPSCMSLLPSDNKHYCPPIYGCPSRIPIHFPSLAPEYMLCVQVYDNEPYMYYRFPVVLIGFAHKNLKVVLPINNNELPATSFGIGPTIYHEYVLVCNSKTCHVTYHHCLDLYFTAPRWAVPSSLYRKQDSGDEETITMTTTQYLNCVPRFVPHADQPLEIFQRMIEYFPIVAAVSGPYLSVKSLDTYRNRSLFPQPSVCHSPFVDDFTQGLYCLPGETGENCGELCDNPVIRFNHAFATYKVHQNSWYENIFAAVLTNITHAIMSIVHLYFDVAANNLILILNSVRRSLTPAELDALFASITHIWDGLFEVILYLIQLVLRVLDLIFQYLCGICKNFSVIQFMIMMYIVVYVHLAYRSNVLSVVVLVVALLLYARLYSMTR